MLVLKIRNGVENSTLSRPILLTKVFETDSPQNVNVVVTILNDLKMLSTRIYLHYEMSNNANQN